MIQMEIESRRKDKIMHGIIFVLVILIGMGIMIVVDKSFKNKQIEIELLKIRIQKLENWTNEVEKNGIGL